MTFGTNILITYLANEAEVIFWCHKLTTDGVPLILPAIVEAELLAYPAWDDTQRSTVE